MYDIPLTVGYDDRTQEGIGRIKSGLAKLASAALAGAGLQQAFRSILKFGEQIRTKRILEFVGGNLENLRKISGYVLTDIELMNIHIATAGSSMRKYATDIVHTAGMLKTIYNINPSEFMTGLGSGRMTGMLKVIAGPEGLQQMRKAKNEAERLGVVMAILNKSIGHSLTTSGTLADNIEVFGIKVQNIIDGPGWQFVKILGLASLAVVTLAAQLKTLSADVFIRKLFSMGSFKTLFSFGPKGQSIGAAFTAGFGDFTRAFKMPGIVTAIATMGVLMGLIGELKTDFNKVIKILPEFIGGFDAANNRFMITKQLTERIQKANAAGVFRTIGKAIIWVKEASVSFINVFKDIGAGIAAVITPLVRVVSLFDKTKASKGIWQEHAKFVGGLTATIIALNYAFGITNNLLRLFKYLTVTNPVLGLLTVITTALIVLEERMGGVGNTVIGLGIIIKSVFDNILFSILRVIEAIPVALSQLASYIPGYESLLGKAWEPGVLARLLEQTTGYSGPTKWTSIEDMQKQYNKEIISRKLLEVGNPKPAAAAPQNINVQVNVGDQPLVNILKKLDKKQNQKSIMPARRLNASHDIEYYEGY